MPSACFPRARGDGPVGQRAIRLLHSFSPRTRGWTDGRPRHLDQAGVFPAHAGMDRTLTPSGRMAHPFSPRTRGWTAHHRRVRAGGQRFPRARGDGPTRVGALCWQRPFSPRTRGWTGRRLLPLLHDRAFSPRTRGWTVVGGIGSGGNPVFPAHAGMDRVRWKWPASWLAFSPRTRGWTGPARESGK